MPTCLITIRPSTNDYILLEDYLILFKTWLEKYKYMSRYSWSIEKDDTIKRHLHCYLEHSENKGCGKIKEQLKTTIFKSFIKTLPHTTIADVMINVINADDTKYYLGYANKDHTKRHDSTVSDEEIISSLKYYYMTEKYKSRVLEEANSSNWKHVTSRTFHVMVEDYLKKNPELSLRESSILILSMKSNFYTFQLPVRDMERFLKEMKLSHNVATHTEKYSASLEAVGQGLSECFYHIDDIKYLLKFVWNNVDQLKLVKIPELMNKLKKHQYLFDENPDGQFPQNSDKKYEGLCCTPPSEKCS